MGLAYVITLATVEQLASIHAGCQWVNPGSISLQYGGCNNCTHEWRLPVTLSLTVGKRWGTAILAPLCMRRDGEGCSKQLPAQQEWHGPTLAAVHGTLRAFWQLSVSSLQTEENAHWAGT